MMEKDKLKTLVVEHKERFLSRTGLVGREIQKDMVSHLKAKEIILITGVRRSGKSSLMKLIADDIMSKQAVPKQNIMHINFEDERFIDFSVKDFEPLYEAFLEIENPQNKKYFFFDEIQNIVGWEKWVNRMYEFEDVKFFITGSSASMRGSTVSTALTGRNRQLINWPFSFREFLALRKVAYSEKDLYLRDKKIALKVLLKEYVKYGGFPEVLKLKDNTLLEDYFRDMIYRDVIAGYSIRNVKELKELCLYLISNPATIYSYDNLKNILRARNIGTIKNYLDILENIFLFHRLSLFDFSVKRQIYNPGKFYVIDVGLSQTMGFKFSSNIGHIYENVVFLELKRRNKDLYYWKSKKGKEVDFLTRKGAKIEEAIQVCFNLNEPETKKREIDGLLAAKDELNPDGFTVITEDDEQELKINKVKIKTMPLWKWLLLKDQ